MQAHKAIGRRRLWKKMEAKTGVDVRETKEKTFKVSTQVTMNEAREIITRLRKKRNFKYSKSIFILTYYSKAI